MLTHLHYFVTENSYLHTSIRAINPGSHPYKTAGSLRVANVLILRFIHIAFEEFTDSELKLFFYCFPVLISF